VEERIDGGQTPVRVLHQNGIQGQERSVEDEPETTRTAHKVGNVLVVAQTGKENGNDVKGADELRNAGNEYIASGPVAAKGTENHRARDKDGVSDPKPVGDDGNRHQARLLVRVPLVVEPEQFRTGGSHETGSQGDGPHDDGPEYAKGDGIALFDRGVKLVCESAGRDGEHVRCQQSAREPSGIVQGSVVGVDVECEEQHGGGEKVVCPVRPRGVVKVR